MADTKVRNTEARWNGDLAVMSLSEKIQEIISELSHSELDEVLAIVIAKRLESGVPEVLVNMPGSSNGEKLAFISRLAPEPTEEEIDEADDNLIAGLCSDLNIPTNHENSQIQ